MSGEGLPAWIVGHAVRTTNSAESDPERAQLGRLWERVTADRVLGALDGRVGEELYAVLTEYESDEDGAYVEVVGVGIDDPGRIPAGLVAVRTGDGPVARFSFSGPMPAGLLDAWREVWDAGPALGRTFGTDIEIHRPDGSGELLISVTSDAPPVS